jgi:hypothetical protein
MTKLVTGTLGRFPLISVQDVPPLVVLNTWPTVSTYPEKPPYVTYAVVETVASTFVSVMARLAAVLTLNHVELWPESAVVVRATIPSLDPV